MRHVVDLLYYVIFQLSRKGVKQNHHLNAVGTLALFLMPIYAVFLFLVISPIIDLLIQIKPSISFPVIMILSGGITYFYAKENYGHNGKRNNIIKDLHKKSWLTTTSKYLDGFLLWAFTIGYILLCTMLFWVVKGWIAMIESDRQTVDYSYNNTTVRRIERNGKSTFYYMDGNKERGRIWAKYSGINDGFAGYLQFEENGKVSILSGDGAFFSEDLDTNVFNYRNISASSRPKDSSNVCVISYPIESEQRKNKSRRSEIEAKYVE